MDIGKAYAIVARDLGRSVEDLQKLRRDQVTCETTGRPKETPRPDWIEVRGRQGLKALPDFIAEKFAAEIADGAMHRGLFTRYEKLRRDFYSYERSNELPAWLAAFPTEKEWNDRHPQAAVKPARSDEVRRYDREQRRFERAEKRALG